MYLPRTGKNFQPWKLPQVATYRPFEAECGEMMKSPLVVKASLYIDEYVAKVLRGFDLPADPMFLYLPRCTFLPIEDFVGKVNVLSQSPRDLPLSVVWFWRWHRDVTTG